MNKKQNTTSAAWLIYQEAEVKAGRKFAAADRKGKDGEWAKAMRIACQLVATEIEMGLTAEEAMRRANRLAGLALSRAKTDKLQEPYKAKMAEMKLKVDAVRNQLVPVPEYDQYSLDQEKRSESQRRAKKAAEEHNSRIILAAITAPLSQQQEEEAKALGMTAADYRIAKKWADIEGMTVTERENQLKAEEEAAKEKERKEAEAWSMSYWADRNKKKVAAMRGRYARRGRW